MNGKDVDKSEGEHHVVETQGCTAKPKCFLEHPETEEPTIHQSMGMMCTDIPFITKL